MKNITTSNKAWLVFIIASLFFFYEFIQMSVFNAISDSLLKDLSIGVTSLGNIAAAYSYSMVLFLLPAGILLDLFSPKKIMLIAFSLSVTGTLLFSFATTALHAEFCRMLSGIGGAFAFLSCIKIASQCFPARKMSFAIGVLITIAFLGGAIAQTPFTLLVEKFGWQITVRLLAFFGLTAIFLIYFFVKDANTTPKKAEGKLTFFRKVLLSLVNLQTWLGGIYIMLMNLPIVLLGTLWGTFYLTEARHLTHIEASYITTMLFVGIMIGSPIFGFISDKTGKRKLPLILGCFFTLFSSFFLFNYFSTMTPYLLIFFSLGFFSSAQGVGYPTIVENNFKDLAGTASGIASIMIMGGGALFKIFYAYMLDQHWKGKILHGIPIYSRQDFHTAMLIMPISFAIALVIAFLIKETFGKAKAS